MTYRRLEEVHRLLACGTSADERGGKITTPLQAAAIRGRTNTVQLLLDYNADVSVRGPTETRSCILSSAVRNGHVEVAELLIKHGADVSRQDKDGVSPLAVCCKYYTARLRGEESLSVCSSMDRRLVCVVQQYCSGFRFSGCGLPVSNFGCRNSGVGYKGLRVWATGSFPRLLHAPAGCSRIVAPIQPSGCRVFERTRLSATPSTRTRAAHEEESVGGVARMPHGEGMHGTGSDLYIKREMTEISDFLAPRSSRPDNNHLKILKCRSAPIKLIACSSSKGQRLISVCAVSKPTVPTRHTRKIHEVRLSLFGPPWDRSAVLCQ